MKKIFIFFTLFIVCCTSDVPHNMEEELAYRSDRWMKGSDWSWFWYSFQYKVYNGPAYSTHKNGERKVFNCQAIRVKETLSNGKTLYEVAARAVDKNEVKAYRNMLKNRGQ